jgi:hypothetical protein
MPNNREWAILAWLVVGMAVILAKPEFRHDARRLLKQLFVSKIGIALAFLTAWVTVLVLIGRSVHLWDQDDLTDTVFWFVLVALVMFVNLLEAEKSPGYFRLTLRDSVTTTALLSFFVNLFSFPLYIEAWLLPLQVMLVLLAAFGTKTKLCVPTQRLIERLALVGPSAMLLNSGLHLVLDWNSLNKMSELRAALLPVWLTATLLPMLYAVAVFAAYGRTFSLLNWSASLTNTERTRDLKLVLVREFRLRIHELYLFIWSSPLSLAKLTPQELRDSIAAFRQAAASESIGYSDKPDCRPLIQGLAALATGPIGEGLRWSVESAVKQRELLGSVGDNMSHEQDP